jgi:hypothetical protein
MEVLVDLEPFVKAQEFI